MRNENHERTIEESSVVGNAAAMRKALSDACYAMFNFLKTQNSGFEEMAKALDKAKAALAKPPRNCDVGTPLEQYKRFDKICSARGLPKDCQLFEKTSPCCSPLCFARWAQMPYEEGGAE